ncbi:hypothetical protein HYW20_01950 [Candidatus Woesearchaeota archaeon]|nr:hypothetical protein [Candidatus Woesearchaeota archaeon]
MVNCIDIIVTAEKEGYMPDLRGLASRSHHSSYDMSVRIFEISRFISGYEQMWHDVRNADFEQRPPEFSGRQPLYLDARRTQKNPNVSASDYLYTLKEFMRRWAARKHEGSPEKDWDRMQKEFADTLLR